MSSIVAFIRFTDTVNLGAVLVFIGGTAAALVFTLRSNVAKTYRESYEAERVRNGQLVEQLAAAAKLSTEQAATISMLRAATDLAEHQKIMREYNEALTRKATADVVRATKDVEGVILRALADQAVVLERIAAHLDAKENGNV